MEPIRTAAYAACFVASLAAGPTARGHDGTPQSKPSNGPTPPAVTAVAGPSWLNHLGISFRDTSLGRGSGQYGAAPTDPAVMRRPVALAIEPTIALTGADLYRLNCQGCHHGGGNGRAARSPIRAPRRAGFFARPDARSTAARGTWRRRSPGTPDAHAAGRTSLTWNQLGENVVKGTCHICHDAVGPHPGGRALLEGTIPALSVVLAQKSVVEFVDKVRRGAPVFMGDPPMPYRRVLLPRRVSSAAKVRTPWISARHISA